MSLGPIVFLFTVALAAPLGAPTTARAQNGAGDEAPPGASEGDADAEAQARALFSQGAAAFEDGRYEAALGFFEDAYRISGRHLLLYNIGQAQDRLRRDQEALDTFRRYLEVVEDPPYRLQVESRIRSLEESVERQQREHEALEAAQRREEERLHQEDPTGGGTTANGGAVTDDEDEGGGILSKWWFWTIVGVVVVGGIAIGVGAAASGGTEEPIPGDVGGVVRALSF